ncbi:MAG: DNA-protecting protein DprA [Bacteroidetes bacterium]|nr:DNA-protecting protein DprA [Bacteroidota bacterium]
MKPEELLYTIALSSVKGIGDVLAKNLIAYCGSAEAVFKTGKTKLERIPGIGSEKAKQVSLSDVMKIAETELKFISDYHITPLVYTDDKYPQRLKECSDSPVLLYYKGSADLNAAKVVAIVGTRRATDYGKEQTKKLIAELAAHNVLVVSGLAYGIDICAHKAALENGLETVGVLGHGLNTIYPATHKATAKEMVEQGGLLTEYRSTQEMHPSHFANRNRIVAGMSDAVILMESAIDGGAVITANVADSYHKDVFAYPGKANDKWSAGCNNLIKLKRATMIENAADLLREMNWDLPEGKSKKVKSAQQRTLAIHLSESEQLVYNLLNEQGEKHIDELSDRTGLSTGVLAATLLEMEMNNLILSLPGKMYKLA